MSALAVCLFSATACSDFLDREPDKIMTDDQIFGDAVMIKSVLANYYGRVTWGQHINDSYSMTYIDDAAKMDGGPDQRSTFEDDLWRVYDYTFIRNVNQFLKGLRETEVLKDSEKAPLEGEARFLRAWCYFNMCRGLGGMPIIGDEVFDYQSGMDITTMQFPRSTEAEMYDYIISECQAVYNLLPAEKQINSARANRWTAKMLEARAAVYAASIANYNNKMSTLQNLNISMNLAKEVLNEAYEKMKNSVTPKFTENLSNNISNITNGKYDKVMFNESEGLIVALENGDYVPVNRFSIGTIDQLYLSLRLSMINELSDESVPIFLDEAFAFYDDDRLENILEYLNTKFSDRQIIIFTCTNREKNILKNKNIDYNYIEL